ncbi:MAG: hypothetical protein AB8G16_14230 [Gammaproteobacteria bacterium]
MMRRAASFVASAAVCGALAGCGVDSLESVSMAENVSEPNRQACSAHAGDTFTLRVVYDVTNTHERDALKRAGAPAQAKGHTRSELLIREQSRLIRRTGKTYVKDPQKWWAWKDDGEFMRSTDLTAQERMDQGRAWEKAGDDIPMKTVPIEWAEFRTPAPRYSYRYGIDPMAPHVGQKWRERQFRFDPEQINAALFAQQFVALQPGLTAGLDVSSASFAGHECEMLRRRSGDRVHETCYAQFGEHTVVLHGMDSSSRGVYSQTAVKIEHDLCVSDQMLAAPDRVDLEEVTG